MELHTLGVDGGYTQKDVTEVARAFTGWTIANPRQGGGFIFEPRIHDPEQKIVLGHTIKGGRRASRRRAGARHPGEASVDRALHRGPSWFDASSATRLRPDSSIARPRGSGKPTAICAK
jgi:uncharacterized protein (DUF1800 family)